MTIQDTYKYGSLYVDANNTIEFLDDQGLLTDRVGEILEQFQESGVDFEFDDEWQHGKRYDDEQQLPLVQIGWFGGYPGEAMDDANAQAALEWAEDREHIVAYRMSFGGCQSVQLLFDPTNATLEDAVEAVELAEGFAEYPVLDESLYSEISSQRFSGMLEEMIWELEREHGLLDEETRELLHEHASEYYGYWEEGYFGNDEWESIVSEVLDTEGVETQLHQETKLF